MREYKGEILLSNVTPEDSSSDKKDEPIKIVYRGRDRLFILVGLAGLTGGLMGVAALGLVLLNPPSPSPEQIQQIKTELKSELVAELSVELDKQLLDPKTELGRVRHDQRITMSGFCDILIKVSEGQLKTQSDCFNYLDQQYHGQGGE